MKEAPEAEKEEAEISIKGDVLVLIGGTQHEGWRAGRLRRSDNGDYVPFVGNCEVERGETVTLHGKWTEDPKYGLQFKVAWSVKHLPEDWSGIQKLFELDGRFKDIGPVRSRAIVDAARDMGKSLDQILENFMLTEELRRRSGVPEKAITVLAEQWAAHRVENEVRSNLLSLEIPNKVVSRIWSTLGAGAVKAVRDDPWSISDIVESFSFERADKIGTKLGLGRICWQRLTAALVVALRKETSSGHTWTELDKLVNCALKVGDLGRLGEREALRARLDALRDQRDDRFAFTLVYGFGHVVSEPRILDVEERIEREFQINHPEKFPEKNPLAEALPPDWESQLEVEQDGVKKTPNEAQLDALRKAVQNKKVVITGPAGSGKTFVISLLVKLYLDHGRKVALAAPTGKAARRMLEVLKESGVANRLTEGSRPTTIHRLLECDHFGNWSFNAGNKLETDLLLIDEASMLDIDLTRRILDALPENAALVLVGDPEQLPSVGPGAVLRDILAENRCVTARLEKVMRHAGCLKANAQEILRGVMRPTTQEAGHDGKLWTPWIVEDHHVKGHSVVASIVEHFSRAIRGKAPEELFEVQVISPQYDHSIGIKALNRALQRAAQQILYGAEPENGEEEDGRLKFVEGDKVIQTKNDHKIGLMNGDQGIVDSISKDGVRLRRPNAPPVFVPDRTAEGLMLAYAITVHRAQGSQWNTVIAAVHSDHIMNTRKLVYTAATRATKQMIVVGNRAGIHESIKKADSAHRRTFMAPRQLVPHFAKEAGLKVDPAEVWFMP